MKKKILAGLLALCMIFSMVPMSAFAAEGEVDTTPTAGTAQVVTAPLGDTAENGYKPEQLNLPGYKVEAALDTTTSTGEDITAVYNVKVTHPALLKHNNAQKPGVQGLWVGIGVPITTKGTASGETPAGQAGNGSSYFAFVTAKTDFSTIVSEVIEKFDWASSNSAGYSEWGWRQNDGEHVFQWYDVSKETYKTNTPYLVERNPTISDGKTTYTYIVYRLNFSGVKEGHLVTIEDPTNGTLTVKNGTTEVETGTPVAVGTELTITAEPEQGYKIKAVKVGDSALTADAQGAYTTKITDADITISAEFEAIKHTVTFAAGSADATGSMSAVEAPEGDYALPECTYALEGKVFAGWQIGTDTTVKQAGDKINLTANITLTATWTEKVSTGISVGFEWNGDDANSAINLAVRKADKVYPVSDSIDASYWLLLNEPMTDESKKHAYEIKLGSRLVKEDVFSGGEGKVGIWYDSFQMKKKGNDDTYVDADIPVNPGDTLTFTVYPDETKTGTAITETITIPANLLEIASAEATNIAEGKITVKFNNDLLGRYTIEVKKGDTPVASATTECNRAPEANDAGKIAKETGIELTANEALTAGTYTVTLKPTITGAEDIDTKEFTLAAETITEISTEVPGLTVKVVGNKIVLAGSMKDATATVALKYKTSLKIEEQTVNANYTQGLDGAKGIWAFTSPTLFGGTAYELDATGVTFLADNVEIGNAGEPDVKPIEESSKVVLGDANATTEEKEAAKTALTTAVSSTSAEFDSSNDTLSTALATVASELDEATVTKLLKEAEEKDEENTQTKIQVVPYIEVAVTAYDATADTKTLTLDITPKIKYQAVDDNGENPIAVGRAIDMSATDKAKLGTVTISFNVPVGFVDGNPDLYVKHKNYVYTATYITDHYEFDNPHGFSEFEIGVTNPTVAKIGEDSYTSLAAAVTAVKDNETIVLQGNCAENVTVNKAVIFTIDSNGHQFSGEIKAATGFTLKQEGSKYTITKNSGGGGSTGSGGGGSTTTTYPITAPTAEGGKVSVNSSAAAGATVTITTTPDEGKKVDTVTVTDVNGNAIAVTKADTNKYTFVMPSAAVTIKVTFVDGTEDPTPPEEWENPYSDVEKIWYYDAIRYVTENGLMQGTGKDKFEPDTKLTRGMFAQILYNKAGKPEVTGTVDFTDFESGKWYSDAVVWASKNGVLKGYDDGSVGVNDKITREQLATMLWRYVGEPEASADVTVNGSPSKYAVEAMRWAVGAGVIKGDQNGNHNPRGMASRAEAAQMLTNYYNK